MHVVVYASADVPGGEPPEVWRVFNHLYLPKWELDFIQRVLWHKLPVGGAAGSPGE